MSQFYIIYDSKAYIVEVVAWSELPRILLYSLFIIVEFILQKYSFKLETIPFRQNFL